MKTAGLTCAERSARRADMSGVVLSRGRERKLFRLGSIYVFPAVALILLAILSGCTSESSKPAGTKPEVKAPELVTGIAAFRKVYIAARGWQQDAKPYRLEAIVTSDGSGHNGKWAVWRGSFASPGTRLQKSYTWSGSTANGAPERDISPGTEDGYSPTNASTEVFDMAFLKIDSDQAFATAQKNGGNKILEKEPDTPVFYVCDWNRKASILAWHVIYGASRETAKLTVAVDASSGEFIRVEK
jgi:hypothetical protein